MSRLADLRAALLGGPFGIPDDGIICRIFDGTAEMPFTGSLSYTMTYSCELIILNFKGDHLPVLAYCLDWLRKTCPSNKISLPFTLDLIDAATVDLVLRPSFTETVGATDRDGGTALTIQDEVRVMDLISKAFGNG